MPFPRCSVPCRKLTGAGYSKFSSEIAVLHIDQTTGTTSSKEFTVNVSFTTFLLMMYYLSRAGLLAVAVTKQVRLKNRHGAGNESDSIWSDFKARGRVHSSKGTHIALINNKISIFFIEFAFIFQIAKHF